MIDYGVFPKLKDSQHRLTSNPASEENCIAHAAGASGEWWEPVEGRIWPVAPPYDNYRVESLLREYETLGYTVCDSAEYEPAFEKVAVYGKDGEYQHAARQLHDGTWTSKLGPEDDINHAALEALAGGCYGEIVGILRRPRAAVAATKCCESETPLSPMLPQETQIPGRSPG